MLFALLDVPYVYILNSLVLVSATTFQLLNIYFGVYKKKTNDNTVRLPPIILVIIRNASRYDKRAIFELAHRFPLGLISV